MSEADNWRMPQRHRFCLSHFLLYQDLRQGLVHMRQKNSCTSVQQTKINTITLYRKMGGMSR
nr:MAG TPA: hypothetical protein [Caudoviricetes sp.]